MPSLKTFSDKTGLPRLRRWSGPEGAYAQVEALKNKVEQQAGPTSPDSNEVPPDILDVFRYCKYLWEISFIKCIRRIVRWYEHLPESQQYGASVILEKRLRPTYSVPGPPKPPLDPGASEIRSDLQNRVVAEGVEVVGSSDMRGTAFAEILNASHFSNDPGNWSIGGIDEGIYRAVPRSLLLEILSAYPRAGQANSRTESVSDVLAWLFAHGVTAIGQVLGRGRYAIALVHDGGIFDVVCYDPHHYQRVLDPHFRATPEEVHSGKYNNYREGPYDTRYGSVII